MVINVKETSNAFERSIIRKNANWTKMAEKFQHCFTFYKQHLKHTLSFSHSVTHRLYAKVTMMTRYIALMSVKIKPMKTTIMLNTT